MAELVDIDDHIQLDNEGSIMVYSARSGTWVELYYNDGEWEIQCGDVEMALEPDGQVFVHNNCKIATR
jgi:hypothetical protein